VNISNSWCFVKLKTYHIGFIIIVAGCGLVSAGFDVFKDLIVLFFCLFVLQEFR